MVSKTEVIIQYMLKNSKEERNRVFSNRLGYYYYPIVEKRRIRRIGEITEIRASYYEIKVLYEEFIEAGVNK